MELTSQDLINAANQGHLRALTKAVSRALNESARDVLRKLDPVKTDTFKNEAAPAVCAEAFNQTISDIAGKSNRRSGGLIAYPLKPPRVPD